MIGDPYGGSGCLRSNNCDNDNDCGGDLICQKGKCVDLCSTKKCSVNAICQVDNGVACKLIVNCFGIFIKFNFDFQHAFVLRDI